MLSYFATKLYLLRPQHPLPFCPEMHFSEFNSAIADMKNSVKVSKLLFIPAINYESIYLTPTIFVTLNQCPVHIEQSKYIFLEPC